MRTERPVSLINSLNKEQQLVLNNVINFQYKTICWDVDQILMLSEEPVKKAFDDHFGTSYSKRRIDKWMALATWAKTDGFDFDTAANYERSLWVNPEILGKAEPNPEMQLYSRKSFNTGTEQIVVTGRITSLTDLTFSQLKEHYPWIPRKNIYVGDDNSILHPGEFKAQVVNSTGAHIHFEDSIKDGRKIIDSTGAWLMLFPRGKEQGGVSGSRVIEFPNRDVWRKLLRNASIT